ncbi:vWA domain-containing protein [Marinifilum flexuosum]|uniref:Ca-activated chloride channel family protein n=1 Tax=Marinifilum flexuosum TaxID=1117708 RepID=A0A419X805_9BACT|nr:vWA domain-containing protein [Marinifilum flexuosum]RKE03739.1 Ca-activated chloride channel family protein [Marinifilum flexuosum]
MKLYSHLIIALLAVIFAQTSFAQNKASKAEEKTRILFIFDASQSMNGYWEKSKKIDIARKFLIRMVDSLECENNVEMALRVYGHQSPVPPQDCNDTKLEVPFSPNNAGKIRQTLRYLIPKGTTPIAHSLELSANDFPITENGIRNVVILITDGVEACDGDPCEVSDKLQKAGIILKPFIIGIGLDVNFKSSFECIGNFLQVEQEEKFGGTLEYVMSQVLNKTSAQVNLIDANGSPTETNVAMTFYNKVSGKVRYQFMHTINAKGNPDTLYIDPLLTYNITIHTIPELHRDSVTIQPGKHTKIGFDTPQGFLKIESNRTNMYKDLQTLVKIDTQIINTQKVNQSIKYITGKYNLEVLTLPRIAIPNVTIAQSTTTSIKIPQPGLATIFKPSSGPCSLFVQRKGKLEWIYDIDDKKLRETLTLQPGVYHVIYRNKNASLSQNSRKTSFEIFSGKSRSVRF